MINRISRDELPALPYGWDWYDGEIANGCACWDAYGADDADAVVYDSGAVVPHNAPPEVIALVKLANGIGPDPRETVNDSEEIRRLRNELERMTERAKRAELALRVMQEEPADGGRYDGLMAEVRYVAQRVNDSHGLATTANAAIGGILARLSALEQAMEDR